MKRKLFCEICPFTYQISVAKGIVSRNIRDFFSSARFAKEKSEKPLPVCLYKHNSLIRRTLGNVDMALQENKAVNLSLAAPKVSGILIKPGETFSFWRLVGSANARRGYKEGLTITAGHATSGIGGGMCQFTNLIHWMVLHTSLQITEHHHHDGLDLFPDFNRQIPFGTGTSILYNYLDYRVKNNTDSTYQLIVYLTEEYLCGEIRSDRPQPYTYHIKAENEFFSREVGGVYRNGEVFRRKIDVATGNCVKKECIRKNHARVAYDIAGLNLTLVDLTAQSPVG